MSKKRAAPYIWASWPPKLFAGEDQCEWKAWFKSHYKIDKLPSDFDLTEWTAQHNAMTKARQIVLFHEGYEDVYLENRNSFTLQNADGLMLSGKPDLIAVHNSDVLVIDCKTGNPRHADNFQVLMYMLVLPETHRACKDKIIRGEVQYKTSSVRIEPEKVDDAFKTQFKELMQRLGGDEELKKAPSISECRFCDISMIDCPQRMEKAPPIATDLF